MAQTNTIARALHDIGLAGWFGGSLMGSVGLNGASDEVADPKDRVRVGNAGWARWTPVNLFFIVLHLLGGVQLTRANKGRIAGQRGVASTAGAKTALTLGALGATAYARWLGQKLMDAEADAARSVPGDAGYEAQDAVTPSASTPEDVAGAQRQLRVVQWAIPALTAAVLWVNAAMGEQQRPNAVAEGILDRLRR
jgi:hypothetical protein